MRLVRRPGQLWKEAAQKVTQSNRNNLPEDKWVTLLKKLKESKSYSQSSIKSNITKKEALLKIQRESISGIDEAKEEEEFQAYVWRLLVFIGVLVCVLSFLVFYSLFPYGFFFGKKNYHTNGT